ncbi:MAG: AAA family ATPase, partial [Candidatus Margulisiibacteriota bacterium]
PVTVIVVVRPGLGTINHSLLSLNALKQRKIPVLGFIVNNFPAISESIANENAMLIHQFSRVKCLGIYSENRHTPHFLS